MLDSVVGGQKVIAEIGEGGMGVVYEAEDVMLGRKTAVKMLRPHLSRNHSVVQRFFNEARAAARLRHPGIVEIHSFGYHDDGSAYLVMEFLEGESLEGRLARLGKLDIDEAVRIIRQVCTALAAAHDEGIIHRDLKPDNIFLIEDPDIIGGERIKLLDFGIAKLAGDGGAMRTRAGAVMGTPAYMAPEQCRGAGGVDPRADLYALGCILFRMLCRRVPFEGEASTEVIARQLRDPPPRPRELDRTIDPAIEAVILRLLDKEPARRYTTALEVRRALEIRPAPYRHPTPTPLPINETLPGTGADVRSSRRMPQAEPPASSEPGPPAKTPTTLGASTGQQTPRVPVVAGDGRRRRRRWIAALVSGLLVAGAAAGGGLWMTRSGDPGEPIDAFAEAEKLARGGGEPVDLAAAAAHYRHACVDGDARGCAGWGRALVDGAGVELDRQVGVELLEIACGAGAPRACTRLAAVSPEIWRPGLRADRMSLLERACGGGDYRGCLEQARTLRSGPPTLRDRERAEAVAPRLEAMLAERCDRGEHGTCELLGYQLTDPARSVEAFERGCEAGNGSACLAAARVYGGGELADPGRARALVDDGVAGLTAACDADDFEACTELSIRFGGRFEIDRDEARAAELARKVCELGPVRWCRQLEQTHPEIAQEHGCRRGDWRSCRDLGRRLLDEEPERAKVALRRQLALSDRGCRAGDAIACNAVADARLREPLADQAAAEAAHARAMELLEPACRGGDPRSCVLAARAAMRAELLDHDRAARNAERGCAAEGPGRLMACALLGWLYEAGHGVDRDPVRARGLYGQACDGDLGGGCHRRATMHHSGTGIDRDVGQAAHYYRRACDLDYRASCVALAEIHEAGVGLPADPVKARTLFARVCRRWGQRCADACRLGDSSSCDR